MLNSNGKLHVMLNGVQETLSQTVFYKTGDKIKVQVDGNDVLFQKNGNTFHTIPDVIDFSSYPLLVDTSLSFEGALSKM